MTIESPPDGRLQRITLDAVIIIRDEAGEQLGRGRVINISGSGILMATTITAELDDRLHIEVRTAPDPPDGDRKPLVATIRVTRVQGTYPDREIAGEFLELQLP